MTKYSIGLIPIVLASLLACSGATKSYAYYKGVDLSYINEMEDCGATYYENGIAKDPFQIFADHGANIVRVRLWHDPTARHTLPSQYSGYADVVKSIQRAKNAGMRVMLDFHYSDNWTDPADQAIPHAWAHLLGNTSALATEVYNYTYQTLNDLNQLGLMPELVQVGNETNGNILSAEGADLYPVDFARQATLLNAGLQAVQDAATSSSIKPKTILHVADPNNGDWWYSSIRDAGIQDYDIIGLSFYPEWHPGSVNDIGNIITSLKDKFAKEVMIVEVGSPWTSANNDSAANMMTVLPSAYGQPSIDAQRSFLVDLASEVYSRGGYGTVYWEPAWVSTGCQTQWGTGSHWDNATFFDFNNNLIENGGVKFLEQNYGNQTLPPANNTSSQTTTFWLDMSATAATSAYITGSFSGDAGWQIIEMQNQGNGIFSYTTQIPQDEVGAYYFLQDNDWSSRETVPSECALQWGSDRQYQITGSNQHLGHVWQSCQHVANPQGNVTFRLDLTGVPHTGAYITGELGGNAQWQLNQMAVEATGIYRFTTSIDAGSQGAFYFLNSEDWQSRETVPAECALVWDVDRQFTIASGYQTISLKWASCDSF
ncbi:hypothetical protein C2869_21950 (plasmid) [Saccharobesus litoralis]|uniref:Arabinogalactan endo-beta-1,4-galactanase n=1 Tax=Saccharobesus litoralis TaxID=2172099 RepID=A0A2S0VY99_9ALTE|nr:glycosyl hydrolase 53 family protein [Saccharobesus litoralis]AWB69168.1 hypothetical protein C2869_21950 [Saccharobesus litoralis]